MAFNFWNRSLFERSVKKPRRERRRKSRPIQPTLEQLETRALLSTATATPFFILAHPQGEISPMGGNGPAGGYTPSQITQAYGFNKISFTNNGSTVQGNGAGQTIAIVDAYNDPNITSDLKAFDAQFGLPNPNFRVIGQTGGAPPTATDLSGNWEVEESLDVEWAHAVAPNANIVLVEANSSSLSDLMTAVKTAANLSGMSVVSMSWGASEFSGETSYDSSYFSSPNVPANVAFVGSSGDSGAPPIYPAASRNVLAVGGTTLSLTSSNTWSSETAWSGSGGGISSYEAQPSYQKGIVSQSSTQRTNPDVAYDANPNTGFAVYDSYPINGGSGGWLEVGGTSDAAPQWAGLVAIADQGRALKGESNLGYSQLLPDIYQMPASNFHNITSGSSAGNPSYSAGPGYDLATGLGTPIANLVVNSLVSGSSTSPPPSPSPPPAPPPAPPPSPPPAPPPSPSPPPSGNLILDGGFEQPSVGSGNVVGPTGTAWSYYGSAGVAGNGNFLTSGNPAAPQGTQVGFLHNYGSQISQTVQLTAGNNYTISFDAAQTGYGQSSYQEIEVFVDNTPIGLLVPGSTSYISYTTAPFYVTASGNYAITFVGLDPRGGYNTAFLDQISVQATASSAVSPPQAPTPSAGNTPSGSTRSTAGPHTSGGGNPAGNTNVAGSQPPSFLNILLADEIFIQTELNQLLLEFEALLSLIR